MFVLAIILSFTDLPYYAYHQLGTANSELKEAPTHIIILGGSGMPSPDGLIRCYYGAKAAKQFPNTDIIIAHPLDSGKDSLYQVNLMKHELKIRRINPQRINQATKGVNTYTQAKEIARLTNPNYSNLLIITSPEHMYRAIKTFEKAGFKNVGGQASFDTPIDEIHLKNKEELKEVNLNMRYNMWSYLQYEIMVLREYTAITYYWLKGWI